MTKKMTKPAPKRAAAQMDSGSSVTGEAKLKLPSQTAPDLDGLELLDREDLIATIKRMVNGGVSLSFHGKRTAMEIARKVRPRITRRLSDFHVGTPAEQSHNMLIEGENLQAMVTLYKYRGQIDLIVADPPYNTGQYFRYNDRWDEDPNDPELGTLVTLEDGSRHTKWMKAMLPRLSEYVRQRLLSGKVTPRPALDDAQVLAELNRCGVNLNQIAKRLNAGAGLPTSVDKTLEIFHAVLQRVGSAYGS